MPNLLTFGYMTKFNETLLCSVYIVTFNQFVTLIDFLITGMISFIQIDHLRNWLLIFCN